MKESYVYILRCSDDTLYTGYATDVLKRVKAHNDKKGAKYTKSRLPVTLVYMQKLESKSAALKMEAMIKKLSRKEKLLLIDEYQRKQVEV